MQRRGVALAIALSVTPFLTCWTEAQPAKDLSQMSLEELLAIDVTVASRSKEQLLDASSSVTVFTAEEIRRMGIQSLEELLSFVPSFFATRDVEQGTAFRLGARGRSKFNSEFVLVLLDGQRLNDIYTGGPTLLNRYVALEDVKQVEIIRGPGSALYGSGAFLGVVNLVTDEHSRELALAAGNMDSRRASARISTELGSLGLHAFVRAFSDKGLSYTGIADHWGRTGTTTDPLRGGDAFVSLRGKGLHLTLRHMERHLEDFFTIGTLQNRSSNEDTRQSSARFDYQSAPAKGAKLSVSGGYAVDDWSFIALQIPSGVELAPDFQLTEANLGGPHLRTTYVNAAADLEYQARASNVLTAGVSYDRGKQTQVQNLGTHDPFTLEYKGGEILDFPDGAFNETASRQVLGAYLQDSQELTGWLKLVGGVRLDAYDDSGNSINPRAAALVKTPFHSRLKLMYGEAFRAPSFLELYDKNNPVDYGNRSLSAEKVRTVELAYIQSQRAFTTSLTFFHNTIHDVIGLGDAVDSPNNPFRAPPFHNVAANQSTSGLELELLAQPHDKLVLRGCASYLFDANALPAPPFQASLVVNYEVWRFNINVNGFLRQGMRQLPKQGGYFVGNATFLFKVAAKAQLTASLKNLSDERYRTLTTPMPDGIPNRGRIFEVGLRAQF